VQPGFAKESQRDGVDPPVDGTRSTADPVAEGAAAAGDPTPNPVGAPLATSSTRVRRSRRREAIKTLVRLAKAVADVDPASIEATAEQFGSRRPYLAPIAWAAGSLVLLVRGIKLLIMNWRLLLIQLLPAAWIWIAMYDLKQHTLRGAPFREIRPGGVILLSAVCIALSIAAFWCNVAFAYAIDRPPPPLIRPAARRTNKHMGSIVSAGFLVGGMLAGAAVLIPRLDMYWLFVVCLSAVLGIMILSFIAVPAHIIGKRPQKLPPKQAIGRTATGWALSAVAMTPGVVLDRVGLIMIGIPGLRILGFIILSIGTTLYAAGMSTVKAVKISIKLGHSDDTAEPHAGSTVGAGDGLTPDRDGAPTPD
jgi:hypothetical protein